MTHRQTDSVAAENRPLAAEDFATEMQELGPFEPRPFVAVAVSGGADSLALALLMHDWVTARGGRILALTVDHRLRPAAAGEARWVRRLLAARGIAQTTLVWRHPEAVASVAATARRARYALLSEACARRGILHLALAHHRDDQAETLLLRLGRGSGLDGLAAMPALGFAANVRLLRPLLDVPKTRLIATLTARGCEWVEDPSNDDTAFARIRLRRLAPLLAAEGMTAARLATTARQLARARAAIEQSVVGLLARAVEIHPAGFLWLDRELLRQAPDEVALRALARCLMTVGGGEFTPRLERLLALYSRIQDDFVRGTTLGGCRLVPRRGRVLMVREAGRAPTLTLRPGTETFWDGRFRFSAGRRPGVGALRLGPLGKTGWDSLCQAEPEVRHVPLPALARVALPAYSDDLGLISVPILGYRRKGWSHAEAGKCRFAPKNALTVASFTVV